MDASKAKAKSGRNRRTTNDKAKSSQASSGGSGFKSTISEQLIKDIASFSFGTPVGSRVNFSPNDDDINLRSVPGLMTLRWLPSVGWSDGPTSPVNLAARALMTRVRAANSGARNYDQTSLMMYVLAVDSAHMYLAAMKRIYGLMLISSPYSRYMPEALVTACGGDYQDILKNMANLRAYINTYAARLFALPIPKIPLIERHKAMSEGVYMDSQSPKAQLYAFVPDGYYKYQFDEDESLGFLESIPSEDLTSTQSLNPATVAQMQAYGEQLLETILITYGEEDFAIMGGDILKAYGEEGVIRAAGIAEDYTVVPVYDELMLLRINNATGFGLGTVGTGGEPWDGNVTFNVVQNVDDATSSYLQSEPAVTLLEDEFGDGVGFNFNRILNSQSGALDPTTAVEALSFAMIPRVPNLDPPNDGPIYLENAGTEVVTRFMIYYMFNSGGVWQIGQSAGLTTVTAILVTTADSSYAEVATGDAVVAMQNVANACALISAFDWAPFIYFKMIGINPDGSEFGTYTRPTQVLGDINNFAIVTKGDIERIRSIKLLVDFGL